MADSDAAKLAANTDPKKLVLRERVKTELREILILAAYLYVCFAALAAFKAAILQAEGISFAPWAFAAIKALVCAKFLLVGRILESARALQASIL